VNVNLKKAESFFVPVLSEELIEGLKTLGFLLIFLRKKKTGKHLSYAVCLKNFNAITLRHFIKKNELK